MKEVAQALNDAQNIIILPHIFPDADAIGSSCAVKEMLKLKGKECKIILDEKMPMYIGYYLPCEYEVYDENKAYDADLVLCLDCADTGRLGKRKNILDKAKKSVSIDHHQTNTNFADINRVDAKAAATAILVYRLFEFMNMPINSNTAKNLYTAIVGDTGNFKYSNVTSETFEIASKLIAHDIKHWEISKAVYDTEDLDVIKLKGELSSRLELFGDGKICVLAADKNIFSKYNILPEDIDALVEIPRKVRGAEVAVSLKEAGGGIKVSIRSANYVDVSMVAKVFGGGGHARAAGFMVKDKDIFEVKNSIVKEILKVI